MLATVAQDSADHDATPLSWWHAVLLAVLFALAPGVHLSWIAALVGKLRGLSLRDAQLWVSQAPWVFALVTPLSALPPLWLIRQRLPRPPLARALALRPASWSSVAVASITGVALQLPLSEVANVVEIFVPVAMEQKLAMARLLRTDTPLRAFGVVAAIVIAAPLCEELLFRGVLLRGMQRVHGAWRAWLWSSLLFGVAHAGLATAVLPASLAGLALGGVTLRQRSVLPSIALHAAVNSVPVWLTPSRARIEGFNTLHPGVYHVPLPWLVPSCVIAACGLWWLNRSKDHGHPRH